MIDRLKGRKEKDTGEERPFREGTGVIGREMHRHPIGQLKKCESGKGKTKKKTQALDEWQKSNLETPRTGNQ